MGPSCYIEFRGIRNRTIRGFYCIINFIHRRQKYSVSQSRYKKQLGSRGQIAMMPMANLCICSHLQAETDIPSHIPSRYTNDSFLVKLGSSRASSSSSSTSGAGESPPSPPVINPLLLSTTPMPISQFAYAAAASGKETLNLLLVQCNLFITRYISYHDINGLVQKRCTGNSIANALESRLFLALTYRYCI